MQRAWDIELIFPIKDTASAALMVIKADCLHKAGIINETEKEYVHSRAHTFLDDATLKDVTFLILNFSPRSILALSEPPWRAAFKTFLAMATRAGQDARQAAST
jgi:hypothetical protein